MNGLDLFSGIGGMSLALRDYVEPIAYCEIDPFCQAVLLSRMFNGELPIAPIWDNVMSLDGQPFYGHINIIYGGFPCQDISCAGNGAGLEGKRSGLFFEIVRLAKEIKPDFIFLENVPAITTRGGLRVVSEITEMGYDCRWCIISASSIGALHKRERWFLLAHAKHDGASTSENWGSFGEVKEKGQQQFSTKSIGKTQRTSSLSGNVASKNHWPYESVEHWQETVSSMGKCSDGLSNYVDRLSALGNAVVPEQAKQAFEHLMGIKNNNHISR